MPAAHPKFAPRELSPVSVVLTCEGELSWSDREWLAVEAEQWLAARPAVRNLVLDLRAVGFVDSAGLGALFRLNARLRERKVRLGLAHASPTLLRTFQAVGLQRMALCARDVLTAQRLLEETGEQPPPAGGSPAEC